MTDRDRREPQFPIITAEYGTEQTQRLKEYCKEADTYCKKLHETMNSFKTPVQIDIDKHEDQISSFLVKSQHVLNQLGKGEEIQISTRPEKVEFNSFSQHTTMQALEFSRLLDILWPSQLPKGDTESFLDIHQLRHNEDTKRNLRSSLLLHTVTFLKSQSKS